MSVSVVAQVLVTTGPDNEVYRVEYGAPEARVTAQRLFPKELIGVANQRTGPKDEKVHPGCKYP